jgi:hypothetical protein
MSECRVVFQRSEPLKASQGIGWAITKHRGWGEAEGGIWSTDLALGSEVKNTERIKA